MASLDSVLNLMQPQKTTEVTKETTVVHRFDESDKRLMTDSMLKLAKNVRDAMNQISDIKDGLARDVALLNKGFEQFQKASETATDERKEAILKGIKQEIGNIKMPDIPKPKDVDLSNVIKAIQDNQLHTLLAIKNIEMPTINLKPIEKQISKISIPEKPRKWQFDIERDVMDNIVKVTAEAK